MIGSSKLKKGFRQRWNHPDRVAGWVNSGLNIEFNDPVCRAAWMAALRRAVAGAPVRDVLDVGTGPGTIAQLWAEMGCRTTGMDFAPAMLKAGDAAATNKRLSIAFVEGDAEAPPFSRKRFDVISSRFVLFTLPHPGYAVRRWVQLLRPNGRIVLIGHEHPPEAKPRPRGWKLRPKWRPDKQHQEALRQLPFVDHSPGDLIVVLEAAGLRDIRRVPMDKVIAARMSLCKRQPSLEVFRNNPFILVGRKEP
ncbi:MAG: class I SAM-dependent methyltransferase [Verrucomicrobia bacterium]|nr:class I SAM-dependent methyltransferase [Verrucomicrobiota bacterium]